MQSPKALDEFPSDLYGEVELFPSRLTALEELNFFTIWCHLCLPGEEDGTTPAIYQLCQNQVYGAATAGTAAPVLGSTGTTGCEASIVEL